MASPRSPNGEGRLPVYGTKEDVKDDTAVLDFERPRHARTKTPESLAEQQNGRLTPNTPAVLGPFDWDDFEARYEKALVEADEQEREVLKEAENLAKVRHATSFHCFLTDYTKASYICSIFESGLRLPPLTMMSER
jgi:hypothetical protein